MVLTDLGIPFSCLSFCKLTAEKTQFPTSKSPSMVSVLNLLDIVLNKPAYSKYGCLKILVYGLFTIILKPIKKMALGSVRPGFESWLCVTFIK